MPSATLKTLESIMFGVMLEKGMSPMFVPLPVNHVNTKNARADAETILIVLMKNREMQ